MASEPKEIQEITAKKMRQNSNLGAHKPWFISVSELLNKLSNEAGFKISKELQEALSVIEVARAEQQTKKRWMPFSDLLFELQSAQKIKLSEDLRDFISNLYGLEFSINSKDAIGILNFKKRLRQALNKTFSDDMRGLQSSKNIYLRNFISALRDYLEMNRTIKAESLQPKVFKLNPLAQAFKFSSETLESSERSPHVEKIAVPIMVQNQLPPTGLQKFPQVEEDKAPKLTDEELILNYCLEKNVPTIFQGKVKSVLKTLQKEVGYQLPPNPVSVIKAVYSIVEGIKGGISKDELRLSVFGRAFNFSLEGLRELCQALNNYLNPGSPIQIYLISPHPIPQLPPLDHKRAEGEAGLSPSKVGYQQTSYKASILQQYQNHAASMRGNTHASKTSRPAERRKRFHAK